MQGKRLRAKHLDVRILASPLLHPRVGFVIPKYGHSAVDRNQLKRRLREVVRISVLADLPVVDVVIKAQPSAYTAPLSVIGEELSRTIGNVKSLFA